MEIISDGFIPIAIINYNTQGILRMFGFFKRGKKDRDTNYRVASLPQKDEVLEAYQQEAQKGLPYLIEFMESHDEDDELFRYAVKTNFVEDGNSEHMWVQVKSFKDGFFEGMLANTPSTMKLIKYGDTVKVARDEVEDFILEDFLTNTKVGGFSSNYIRGKAK